VAAIQKETGLVGSKGKRVEQVKKMFFKERESIHKGGWSEDE